MTESVRQKKVRLGEHGIVCIVYSQKGISAGGWRGGGVGMRDRLTDRQKHRALSLDRQPSIINMQPGSEQKADNGQK